MEELVGFDHEGTYKMLEQNIASYATGVKNIGALVKNGSLMEHHYQQVIHYLKKIDYHMEEIGKLGADSRKSAIIQRSCSFRPASDSGIVKEKVDHYNNLLSATYWEQQMDDIDKLFEPKMVKARAYRSMDNILSSKDLAPMPVKTNSYQEKRRKSVASNTLPNMNHKPKIIGAVMKSPELSIENI